MRLAPAVPLFCSTFIFTVVPLILDVLLFGEYVDSHGVEVAHCLTGDGNVRIYIKSWHPEVATPSEASTMAIEDGQTSVTTGLLPTGWVKDKPGSPSLDLPGCDARIRQDTSCTSGYADTDHWEDWAYFDFALEECNLPVKYTLIQGTSVVLENGCDDIYPTVVSDTFSDTLAPNIYVDDDLCYDGMVVSSIDSCAENLFVNYTVSVFDDCDRAPTFTVDAPSGDIFPYGDTDVTVTAEDDQGKTSTCTFVLRRQSSDCPCCDCFRRASIRPDPHYNCWDGTSYFDFQGSCDQYAIKNPLLELQVRSRGRNYFSTLTEVGFKWLKTGETFHADGDGTTNGNPGQATWDFTEGVYVEENHNKWNEWVIKFNDDPLAEIRITTYYDELSVQVAGTGEIFCGSEGMLGSWNYGGVLFPDDRRFDVSGGYSGTGKRSEPLALSWQVPLSESLMTVPSDVCTKNMKCGNPPKPVPCPTRTFKRSCNNTCADVYDEAAKLGCLADNAILGNDANIYACNPATTDPLLCPEGGCDIDKSGFAEAPPVCDDRLAPVCGLLDMGPTGLLRKFLCSVVPTLGTERCRITCGDCCEDNLSYTFEVDDEVRNCAWIKNQTQAVKDEYCSDESMSEKCIETCDSCYDS